LVFDREFSAASIALIAVVLGHYYSPWIGWKGGRGLATAAGGSLVVNPIMVILWALLWMMGFFPTRNIHISNIIATILSPVSLIFLPNYARSLALVEHPSHADLLILASLLCALIFIRHLGPLRELLKRGDGSSK
jgi:acyl phosphate:glycerol-3-phosphate acyltransferase